MGPLQDEIAKLIKICEGSFVIDVCRRLDSRTFLDVAYTTILLLIDDNPQESLKDLEGFSSKPDVYLPLLVATRKPDSDYIQEAIRYGATDYLDLNRDEFLIRNRIINMIRVSTLQPAHVDSFNRLLFYRCIGPAIMMEMSADETVIHSLMINREFYDLVGVPDDFYDGYDNMIDTLESNERDMALKAHHLAVINRKSDCILSNPRNGRVFKCTYHLVHKGEEFSTLLLTMEDITELDRQKLLGENLLRLPGMTLFSYTPEDDTGTFLITTKKNKKYTKTVADITDPTKQKLIAPESFLLFRRTIQEALEKKVTGNIDIRILSDGSLKWFRMYYRSIPDSHGKIISIVGRMDDLESEDYLNVRGVHSGLCDAETHLPTFHTFYQFVDQVLFSQKKGTLLLLNIRGLEKASASMNAVAYQTQLREIVRLINNQFISTDLIGRFDTECFMAFMPETTSTNLARKKAAALMKTVKEVLPSKEYEVNMGVCIVEQQHGSLDSIISEATIALWQAIECGSGEFRIYNNDQQELAI